MNNYVVVCFGCGTIMQGGSSFVVINHKIGNCGDYRLFCTCIFGEILVLKGSAYKLVVIYCMNHYTETRWSGITWEGILHWV